MSNSITLADLEAKHDPWPGPVPLIGTHAPEPYPLDSLPEVIREAVVEVQQFVQAPLPLVACSALSAVSVVCQALADVQRAEGLSAPIGLFLLIVGASGERKTTTDSQFMAAVKEWEKQRADAAAPEMAVYQAEMDEWKAKYEGYSARIRQAARKGKDDVSASEELEQLQLYKPEPPRIPELLRMDSTPEDLAYKLAHSWPSAGIISSEAGIVLGAHGMGRDSQMRNLGLNNVLWDGGDHRIGRRTSESFTVRGARLTIALQVQQEALLAFTEQTSGLARGMGFFSRFLVTWPDSTQGSRFFTEPPADTPALGRFKRRLIDILDQPVELDRGALCPRVLQLNPAAKDVWRKNHDDVERELAPGGKYYEVRDVASKAADNVARLAALFHVVTGDTRASIAPEFVEAAGRIVAWHLTEAIRVFDRLAASPNVSRAIKLDEWIIGRCRNQGTTSVSRRDVMQLGPNSVRKKESLDKVLELLVESSRVREVKHGNQVRLQVNPALLGGRL